jgi:hypothetical protein
MRSGGAGLGLSALVSGLRGETGESRKTTACCVSVTRDGRERVRESVADGATEGLDLLCPTICVYLGQAS